MGNSNGKFASGGTVNISKKAVIVYCHISHWTARKYDSRISREIEAEHQATDAGRYNKLLIAKEALQNIQKVVSTARAFHYDNSMVFSDNGGRLLPIANYFDYLEKIKEFQSEFQKEVRLFLNQYDTFKESAKLRLNGMFKEADYPNIEELRQKYKFTVHYEPLTQAEYLDVEIGEEMLREIKSDITQRHNESVKKAMDDIWNRLFKVVGKMEKTLSNRDASFKNTLVTNIEDLCKILPKLNVTEDKNLTKLTDEVIEKLTNESAQNLREDTFVREEVAQAAQEILTKMSNAFG